MIFKFQDLIERYRALFFFRKFWKLHRLTSDDITRYYLPGQFTNRKSEFFFPLKKLNPKSFELSLQLKTPSIFNCVTNLTHWTAEIIERSEKLAQLQNNLANRFAEIENETRSLAWCLNIKYFDSILILSVQSMLLIRKIS